MSARSDYALYPGAGVKIEPRTWQPITTWAKSCSQLGLFLASKREKWLNIAKTEPVQQWGNLVELEVLTGDGLYIYKLFIHKSRVKFSIRNVRDKLYNDKNLTLLGWRHSLNCRYLVSSAINRAGAQCSHDQRQPLFEVKPSLAPSCRYSVNSGQEPC